MALNDGNRMPQFGLGLFKAGPGSGTINAINWAFDFGYRLFDTAQFYHNEEETGQAIRGLDVDRSELFVTSKVWTANFGYDKTVASVRESMDKFKLDYLDLFLLHYPVTGKRIDSYHALEDLQQEGVIKSIGVSNFTIRHLDELLAECRTKPVVNQVEFHPWLYQKDLLEKCQSENILLQAYSPLVKGEKVNDHAVGKIAQKYNKTIPQILIRWGLQLGVGEIPKSSKKGRIEENASIFDFTISDEDMTYLNSMDEHYHCTWDPCDEP
jgi:diketogulonate reductase-like aldo/keto reductase